MKTKESYPAEKKSENRYSKSHDNTKLESPDLIKLYTPSSSRPRPTLTFLSSCSFVQTHKNF
jgi:hypothetical protein